MEAEDIKQEFTPLPPYRNDRNHRVLPLYKYSWSIESLVVNSLPLELSDTLPALLLLSYNVGLRNTVSYVYSIVYPSAINIYILLL